MENSREFGDDGWAALRICLAVYGAAGLSAVASLPMHFSAMLILTCWAWQAKLEMDNLKKIEKREAERRREGDWPHSSV